MREFKVGLIEGNRISRQLEFIHILKIHTSIILHHKYGIVNHTYIEMEHAKYLEKVRLDLTKVE